MSNIEIDHNEIISALNSQIASLNFELTVARIYTSKLEKAIFSNSEDFELPSDQRLARNKTKN